MNSPRMALVQIYYQLVLAQVFKSKACVGIHTEVHILIYNILLNSVHESITNTINNPN
jgi:hypothetical protein